MTNTSMDDQDGAEQSGAVALPGSEPATNQLIADIVLRGATRTLRDTLRKRMVVAKYDPDKARESIDGRTLITSLGLYGASRLAAKSTAGLAVVAGGFVLKTLYDRGKARQLREADRETGES